VKCLLKYEWVKLPRDILPNTKGILNHWAKLASRAAFRNGQAKYCGHINEVMTGTWSGGVVGLKSILKQKSRAKTLEIMNELSKLGYISYALDVETKKLTYKIKDFVVECSGADCTNGNVYATDGYGFLCLPRNITERLAEQSYKFQDSDAWLDLWCHTVYQDPKNAFSYKAPIVQYGRYGAALTLENLGNRWGWEKTKVWRFLRKHGEVFTLYKLPGSYGCLIFNKLYPVDTEFTIPTQTDIVSIIEEIRIQSDNTYIQGTDNHKLNKMVAWYSKKLNMESANESEMAESVIEKDRVADLEPIIYAYISQCWNCKKYILDCQSEIKKTLKNQKIIRGPCPEFGHRFPTIGGFP